MNVPFFRPELTDEEIEAVSETLRSGWLTTGPQTAAFETEFAEAVGARHAVALNSCTAALHLGTVALGLGRDEGVLVPTMTFAATAEVVRYAGAHPILIDCDPVTLNMDLEDAGRKLEAARRGELPGLPGPTNVVGVTPVHVGGLMMNVASVQEFADAHGLWIVEDCAHAFPAAWRESDGEPWQRAGEGTAAVSCYSFYANKTMTTGEGGMATTDDDDLAAEMRSLSLHGLSTDAWGRYSAKGSWDYRILAPGYKYNLTDIASSLGRLQLARAQELRARRRDIAEQFLERLEHPAIELPLHPDDRQHAWHLFQVKLHLDRLDGDRQTVLDGLRSEGVGFSVHWRPLHLHTYYEELGWTAESCPVATEVWARTISLPIFPAQRPEEVDRVIEVLLRQVDAIRP